MKRASGLLGTHRGLSFLKARSPVWTCLPDVRPEEQCCSERMQVVLDEGCYGSQVDRAKLADGNPKMIQAATDQNQWQRRAKQEASSRDGSGAANGGLPV